MTLPRRWRDALIVGVLVVVTLLVLDANTKAPARLNAVDRAVLRVTAPVQRGIAWCLGGLGVLWTRYVDLVHVKADNLRLADENARLKAELGRVRLEVARTDQLAKLLDLRAQVPSETVAAHVIGVDTSAFFRVVRVKLDRGENEVKAGMPVLVPDGVVGRVGRVFGGYCDVQLAVDPKSSIDVLLPRTGGRGVLRGAAGENGYHARLDYLLRSDEVHEGDEVVTSGIGGAFPRGITVGKLTKVTRRDFGLYQDAEVAPSVDFTRLDEVLVVLAPPPPPDPDAGKHWEPHHGLGVPK